LPVSATTTASHAAGATSTTSQASFIAAATASEEHLWTLHDAAQRQQLRKDMQEQVIKCSLQGRLKQKGLMPEIQRFVLTTSKVTNKGSLVFNRLLLHCLENGLVLPALEDQTLYFQCINIGVGRLSKSNELLEEVWTTYFTKFPKIEKCRGNSQAYNYAARTYETAFLNSLVYPFDGRQSNHVKYWCEQEGIAKQFEYAICCAINGWTCRTTVPEEARQFIEQQRDILGVDGDDIVDAKWLREHKDNVVYYYYHMLKFAETAADRKLFTLAPISDIKCHFLSIDTLVLHNLMKNVHLTYLNRDDFRQQRDVQFASAFNLKGLSSHHFNYFIQTDGVSVCFHFLKPNAAETDSHVTDMNDEPERVIAIDPGRVNMIYGVEQLRDGNVKHYKLTRQQYYQAAGINKRNKKTKHWEEDIATAEAVYSLQSPKTANAALWDEYLSNYITAYKELWEGKTGKKWGRERFRGYRLKHKVVDQFFQTMNGDVKPVIAYGAAKFNSTGRGELSVPVSFVRKRCAEHFRVVLVDEYCTTKVCHRCDECLCSVKKGEQEIS
jgi:hypothetical protein